MQLIIVYSCLCACVTSYMLPLFGRPCTTPRPGVDLTRTHQFTTVHVVRRTLSRPSAIQCNANTTVCFASCTLYVGDCTYHLQITWIPKLNFFRDSLGSTVFCIMHFYIPARSIYSTVVTTYFEVVTPNMTHAFVCTCMLISELQVILSYWHPQSIPISVQSTAS